MSSFTIIPVTAVTVTNAAAWFPPLRVFTTFSASRLSNYCEDNTIVMDLVKISVCARCCSQNFQPIQWE